MGDIIKFSGITTIEIPPADQLEKAKSWGMTKCIVIGTDDEGEFYCGGSFSDSAQIYWLLGLARKEILEGSE